MRPLARRIAVAHRSPHAASRLSAGDSALLAVHVPVFDVIFAHYSKVVRPASARRSLFWEELRLAAGAEPLEDRTLAKPVDAVDLSAWQRLSAHFETCPRLLSKRHATLFAALTAR